MNPDRAAGALAQESRGHPREAAADGDRAAYVRGGRAGGTREGGQHGGLERALAQAAAQQAHEEALLVGGQPCHQVPEQRRPRRGGAGAGEVGGTLQHGVQLGHGHRGGTAGGGSTVRWVSSIPVRRWRSDPDR